MERGVSGKSGDGEIGSLEEGSCLVHHYQTVRGGREREERGRERERERERESYHKQDSNNTYTNNTDTSTYIVCMYMYHFNTQYTVYISAHTSIVYIQGTYMYIYVHI